MANSMTDISVPIASSIPAASSIEIQDTPHMDIILSSLKSFDAPDLFKIMKLALSEAEKRSKITSKAAKSATISVKKTGSMPKGVVPPQLRKPRAWVDFTLTHALQNGWESFTVFQTKKNKETGEKTEEEIEMPSSVMHNGAHIYDDSISEKFANGKQLIHKDAMSLSKHYWAPKNKIGSRHDLYTQFETTYVEEDVVMTDSSSVASSTVKVKMTAAEKTIAAEAKKAAKEAEKAEKKIAKEAEKVEKKIAKEAEKAEKKVAKEAEKNAAKAEKPLTSSVPVAALKKPTTTITTDKPTIPTTKSAAKKPVTATPEWSCPNDGMVHPWSFKGNAYLRNAENEVWERATDGSCGTWQGVYLIAEGRIDDSVSEPVFDDE